PTGALLATVTAAVISVYLVSTFTLGKFGEWFAGPIAWYQRRLDAWDAWRDKLRQSATVRAKERATQRFEKEQTRLARQREEKEKTQTQPIVPPTEEAHGSPPWETAGGTRTAEREYATIDDPAPKSAAYATMHDIPIVPLEETPAASDPFPAPPAAAAVPEPRTHTTRLAPVFRLPSTDLLNEPPARNPYDEQELKETASRIKTKFEEFNVLGNVVQIN